MLRGKPQYVAPTRAALSPGTTRQALGAAVGVTNKTGGNTFTGQPTAAVRRVMNQGARK
jgi:hypothetical protein